MLKSYKLSFYLCLALVSTFFAAQLVAGCSGSEGHTYKDTEDRRSESVRDLFSYWGVLTNKGDFDSVIISAKPRFLEWQNRHCEKESLYAASYLAQSYVFVDRYDSAKVYLDLALDRLEHMEVQDPFIQGMLYNIKAIYAMKTDMDYTVAFDYLNRSLNVAIENRDSINQCIILSNMASLYHQREDPAGLPYAKKAYDMGCRMDIPTSMVFNATYLSAMFFFTSNFVEAFRYIEEALRIQNTLPENSSSRALVYMTYGDILAGTGKPEEAGSAYEEAMASLDYTNSSTAIKLYLSYGDLRSSQGQYGDALEKYEKGLSLADSTNNVEYTHKLLLGLSVLYDRMGNRDKALEYHKKYHDAYNRVFNLRREQEFNNLIIKNEKVKHAEEMHVKELEYARVKGNIIIITAIFVIVSVFSVYSYVLYRRKKKMYSALVSQYNNFVKRVDEITMAEKEKCENQNKTSRKLFNELESLMKVDRIYRRSDLSLNMVSEMLNSNSTYVSKAINTCAGTTFLHYVNSYRMREVISLLSDPTNDEPLKAIADRSGYGNITSFYRNFQKETGCSPSKYRDEMRRMKNESEEH